MLSAVLVMLRSVLGWTVEVTVAELLPLLGSVAPPGAATLAVLTIVALAPAGTFAVTVKVAVPETARFTVALMLPVPFAEPQLEPLEAVQVQFTLVRILGTLSVTVAPLAGLGPSLVTTIV